ncbi:MAG: hypothetical protein U9O82_00850 [Thermodesulfobacteriota bacterium]|nr:hypothetical protein [Thermodesulfobacteriota bacterium]
MNLKTVTKFSLILTTILLLLILEPGGTFALLNPYGRPPDILLDRPTCVIWLDGNNVWHIRWRAAEGPEHTIKGNCISTGQGKLYNVLGVGLAPTDKLLTTANSVNFSVVCRNNVGGIDFVAYGPTIAVSIKIDGQHRPGQVFVGGSAQHPAGMPFSLTNRFINSGISQSSQAGIELKSGSLPRYALLNLGYALWWDKNGWHLRWRTGEKTHSFSGSLSISKGSFDHVQTVKITTAKKVRAKPQNLKFKTTSRCEIDGINFTTSSLEIRLNLRIDGAGAHDKTFLGPNAVKPTAMPFSVYKLDPPQK